MTYKVVVADNTISLGSIFELVKESALHHPHMKLPFDPDHVTEHILDFIYSDLRNKVIFLLMLEDIPVGYLAATCSDKNPTTYGIRVAGELSWYVLPEHRGHGAELVRAYEGWLKLVGAKYSVLTHYNDETGEKIGKLYEKLGYKVAEVSYVKEV